MDLLSNCGYLSYNSELDELVHFPAVLIATLPVGVKQVFRKLFSQEACDNSGKGLEHLLTNWEVVNRFFYSKGLFRDTIKEKVFRPEINVNLLQHYCLDEFSTYNQYKYKSVDNLASSCFVWAPALENMINVGGFGEHFDYSKFVVKTNSTDISGCDYFCSILHESVIKLLVVEVKSSTRYTKTQLTATEITKKISILPDIGKNSPLYVLISSRAVTKIPRKKPQLPVLVLDIHWLQKTFLHISPVFLSAR